MGKSSRPAVRTRAGGHQGTDVDPATVAVVGGREPCPCGSGRRYKLCHGRERHAQSSRLVVRPFEGLPGECDWIALREIVPAATATVRTTAAYGALDVNVATVLPMAWAAMRRADGAVYVGLQGPGPSTDPSRDAASALLAALAADPGTPISRTSPGTDTDQTLQEVLDPRLPLTVSVHEGFDFWLDGVGEVSPEVRDSLERADAAVVPTARLASVSAAYWCRIGERRHLRWVMPQPEDELVDALARLHAARASSLGEGSRYVGSFRAHGLLVPVWDVADDAEADDLEAPAAAFALRLADALAQTAPLSADEQRARAGVASRQLTLR